MSRRECPPASTGSSPAPPRRLTSALPKPCSRILKPKWRQCFRGLSVHSTNKAKFRDGNHNAFRLRFRELVPDPTRETEMKVNAAYVAGAAALMLLGAGHLAFANEPFLPRSERSFSRLDADSDGKMT